MSLGMGLSAAVIRGGGQGDGYVPTPAPVFTGAIGNLTYNTGEAITPVDVSGEFSGAITSYAAVGAWPDGIGVDAGTGIINGTSSDEGVATGLRVQAIGPGGIVNSNTFTTTGNAVNNAPTGSSNIVTTTEDTAYIFSAADFGYSDVDGDVLASIKITALESAGDLTLNGGAVNQNQVITKADIDAGLLLFTPATNANGVSYDSFGFSVNDGTEDSGATYTITIDVTAVNDAPTGTVTIDNMTPTEGDVLTAGNTLADADGMGAIGYQWQRDGVDISGETGTAYTTVTADVGAAIRVVAGYTDGGGSAESVASVSTSAVVAAPSAQTRKFLTFGGSQYAVADVTGLPASIAFSTQFSSTSTVVDARILSFVNASQNSSKIAIGADISDPSKLRIFYGSLAGGTGAAVSLTGNLNDGQLHTVSGVITFGTSMEWEIDGIAQPTITGIGVPTTAEIDTLSVGAFFRGTGVLSFYTGVVANVTVLDNSDGSPVVGWDISSGSTTTESPSIGTGDLTLVNVAPGHWEEFTLSGSEWLSAEYVGDPGFDDLGWWLLPNAQTTISGGEVHYAAAPAGGVYRADVVAAGHRYKTSFDVTSYVTGNLFARLGVADGIARSAVGSYTDYIVAGTANTVCGLRCASGSTISVDNYSVKRVLEIAA
ncbi:MAG: cadherin-like domain-containing protein [Candidatus Sedimenticola sp. (ex Thyasira tokunagai)]